MAKVLFWVLYHLSTPPMDINVIDHHGSWLLNIPIATLTKNWLERAGLRSVPFFFFCRKVEHNIGKLMALIPALLLIFPCFTVSPVSRQTLLGSYVTASNKVCCERNHGSLLHWWSFGEIQYCGLWEVEVANTDDTHGNSSSACNLPVIYSYKGTASRRDRDGESVLFMLAKMC